MEAVRSLYADPALQQRAMAMGTRLLGSTPEGIAARLTWERPI
jgi:hypothetical protein